MGEAREAFQRLNVFPEYVYQEVCVHMMVKGVPFNGIGHSGMGAYHGEWGFREFTHPTTVLIGKTRFNLPLREHPYKGKSVKMK